MRVVFSGYGVKAIGPRIGSTRPDPSKPMIDGDNDGKCQEENGKWVPCPPGVGDGTILKSKESLMAEVKTRRRKYSQKAAKIRKSSELPESVKQRLKNRDVRWFRRTMADPDLDNDDKADIAYQWAEEIFSQTLTDRSGNTFYSIISDITPEDQDYSAFEIEGNITDIDGNVIGEFTRTIDPSGRIVHHDIFRLEEEYQKDGLGTSFIAQSEAAYRALGFKGIETTGASSQGWGGGNKWNGATHWPKNGFDWAGLYAQTAFFSYLRRAIQDYEDGKDDELFEDRQQAEDLKQLMEISKKERPGSAGQTLVAGDFLFWPGAERWFQEKEANIAYVKKIGR